MPASLPRARRVGVVIASLIVLGAGLNACGSDPEDVTCGELLDKSASDRLQFITDGVKDKGTPEEKQEVEDTPDGYQKLTDYAVDSCEKQDEDTKLGDMVKQLQG